MVMAILHANNSDMAQVEAVAQFTIRTGGSVRREQVEVTVDQEVLRLATFPQGRAKLKSWAMTFYPGADSVEVDSVNWAR